MTATILKFPERRCNVVDIDEAVDEYVQLMKEREGRDLDRDMVERVLRGVYQRRLPHVRLTRRDA